LFFGSRRFEPIPIKSGGKLNADQLKYSRADKAEDVQSPASGAMVREGQLTNLAGQKVQLRS